ncbi:MAG: tRNA 4-thiouridine(8) synthase ThiI [bacterium]
MNPCIDCHLLMVKKAGEYMEKIGADFIVTGEVLGERPKSQNAFGLMTVEKESGYKGKLLRPLSAKLLEKTIVENKELVDREKLLAISGRKRSLQIQLAQEFGIKDYPTPAGGCKLTEPQFSLRLKELFANEKKFTINNINLLKIGRHFRTKDGIKIIVGRNEKENNQLLDCLEKNNVFLQAKDYKGPITILQKETIESIKIAAELTAWYSDAIKDGSIITICIGQENKEIKVYPMELKEIEKLISM